MGQNLLVDPFSNKKICLAGVESLRGSRFSLGDHIDLDEAEDEQVPKKQTDKDPIEGPTNDMESDPDVGPSNYRSHSLPSLEILCGTWFALEDRLEPMVLDEAEKEQLDGRPSKQKEPIELDSIHHQSSKGGDSVSISGVPHLPNFKTLDEAEKGQGLEKAPDKEHVEHLSSKFNFQEGEHQDFAASVDKAKPVDAGDKAPEVIILENLNGRRPEELHVPVVIPDSKFPGDSFSSPLKPVNFSCRFTAFFKNRI